MTTPSQSPGRRALAAFVALVLYLTLGTPLAVQAQYNEGIDSDEAAYDESNTADYEGRSVDAVGAEVGEGYDDTIAGSELADEIPVDERYDPATAEAIADASGHTTPSAPEGLDPVTYSLTGEEGSSAVTPQAISLPEAEGSIEGMGESFSPVLSSGTGTFSVPIAVTPGRAGVQPSLALAYSTSGGNGPVGFGWGLGVPFIARQTDRGLPHYVDAPGWHPEEDRFIYNGGQELVPVDSDDIADVDGYGAGALPSGVTTSWQQYRARVEGGFMRFFRSPDSTQWVVQSKDGTRFDFGVLALGEGPTEMIDASTYALDAEYDDGSGRIAMWRLTRMSDRARIDRLLPLLRGSRTALPAGHPLHLAGELWRLAGCDAACSVRARSRALATTARASASSTRHRDDVFNSYTHGWRVETALRLKRVEVTAADTTVGSAISCAATTSATTPTSYHSLLTSVQVEGRPDTYDAIAQVQVGGPATVLEGASLRCDRRPTPPADDLRLLGTADSDRLGRRLRWHRRQRSSP